MNSGQIEDALRGDRFASQYLVGVFAADELQIKEFPGAYVVNTDESNQPGQHWVAFFTINDTIECFDSFGRNPGEYSVHIARWLEDTYQVVQCETLQSRDSTVCGQYCLIKLMTGLFVSLSTNSLVKDKYFLLQSVKKNI